MNFRKGVFIIVSAVVLMSGVGLIASDVSSDGSYQVSSDRNQT
ncbi:hypothetical protein [Bacillus amyloliquefaciens]|nr:hypothetical protein [Bacillus amyloliquefaciens]OCB94903.1 hypothetical protein SRCM101294_01959 [Bacillus amyloliquefaciens]